MDFIYIIVLALCLILLLTVVLYLIVMAPAITAESIKYVDCPDFWKATNNLRGSGNHGCYIPNSTHASYGNIGECKIYYDDNSNNTLDYCSAWSSTNLPTTKTVYTSFTDASSVGLSIDDINATSDCNKLKWAKLNGISWNGISNNYNLINGCF